MTPTTWGSVPYPPTYLSCPTCGSESQTPNDILSDAWISWNDDHGTPETEPPKYVFCPDSWHRKRLSR